MKIILKILKTDIILLAAVWNSFIEILLYSFFFFILLLHSLKIDIFIDIAYLLSTRWNLQEWHIACAEISTKSIVSYCEIQLSTSQRTEPTSFYSFLTLF